MARISIKPLGCVVAEILAAQSKRRLIGTHKSVLFVVKAGRITALGIPQKSFNLSEPLREMDEPLGVVLRDGSHLRRRWPNRSVLALPEMTPTNG